MTVAKVPLSSLPASSSLIPPLEPTRAAAIPFASGSGAGNSSSVGSFKDYCLARGYGVAAMEHGSATDSSASTFSIVEEDHTLANSVRFVLNQDPRVAFCGYSIPHPSDNKVNIRVQTTGDPAKDVLKDSLQDLMVMCQHIRGTFDNAVADYRSNKPAEPMDIDPKQK